MTAPEQLGERPGYIARRMQRQQELREIVAAATPEPDTEEKPAGYYTDAPEHEVAAALATHGRITGRYRPEH
ncbi:hypothetical protein [Streptomyces turgidiscabies]|uniref:hypothetical protein n=1 Tax=Streptomyces turgidiscabies TaxID=85558 RepID=UPI0038F7C03C